MRIIVIGAGVTGIATANALLQRGHEVTLVESASSPNQGCSFGMGGFLGPASTYMLCTPFKGKAGLASVFAKTRRLGWDMSMGQMKFLRQLANARSADVWVKNQASLTELARYSVALTEYTSRFNDISYEQTLGLLRVFTNDTVWEEAHKDSSQLRGGDWLSAEDSIRLEPGLKDVPNLLGSYYAPNELAGNGAYYSKQLQTLEAANNNLTALFQTKVTSLVREKGVVVGVNTDKGEITGDLVILSNNVGALPLIENALNLPIQTVTGWSLTLDAQPETSPKRTICFENKDVVITRLGRRIRVVGRYWLGSLSNDMAKKTSEELYDDACKLLPSGAVWTDSTKWMGQTLVHPDSLPSCGSTNVQGLWLNLCHGLNGWSLASGCAELLADLIEEKKPVINPEPYSPKRFRKP